MNNNTDTLSGNTSIFLVISHLVVILPHISNHSIWVISLLGLCLLWRIGSNLRNWPLPSKGLRFLLVLCGFGAVYVAYGTVIGPLAGVALLILAYTFKLLEARTERDAYMVVTLSYFVVATAFLFDQAFTKALYLLFSSVVISASLISINQPDLAWKDGNKKAGLLILKSLPIMLILFVFVPRIESFWSIQFDNQQARVGLSDEMSPGDIARLGENDSIAFRAKFEGDAPPPAERYWRAMVLDDFDGRRWRRTQAHNDTGFFPSSNEHSDWQAAYRAWFTEHKDHQDSYYRYEVIMEASDKPWLFALDWGRPLSAGVQVGSGFGLSAEKPVSEPFVYQVESLSVPAVGSPPDWLDRSAYADRNLRLPDSGNKRSRLWATALREKAGSDTAFISQVLSYFREQQFFYTLRPPLLGNDSIDHFLFTTQRGFCAHYASTFTFLARSVGIPARVVVGYQGGENSRVDNYLMVYQFDAHAWSEVWLPDRGWVRVDPTAAVSPERIEKGIEDALGQGSGHMAHSPLSLLRYKGIPGVNQLRHSMDYLRMLWIQKVVGYDGSIQTELLQALFGTSDLRTTIIVLVFGLGFVVLLLFLVDFYGSRPPKISPERRIYQNFCKNISKYGYKKQLSEGETAFSQRIALTSPELAESVFCITELYIKLEYRSSNLERVDRDRLVKNLRYQVRFFFIRNKFRRLSIE